MTRLITIFLLLLAVAADGATYKVSQNGNGAATNSFAWFATNAFQPGDTVLIETINSTNLPQLNYSGSAGNPITITSDPSGPLAGFVTTTLPNGAAFVNVSSQSYIVVSNLAMGCTDNGTVTANGGRFDYANGVFGVNAFPANYCSFVGLTITNLYNRTTNSESDVTNPDPCGIFIAGNSNLVQGNFISGMRDAISYVYGSTPYSGFTVISNTITNFGWGTYVACGQLTGDPHVTGVTFWRNSIRAGSMYESPDGFDYFHRDALFLTTGALDNSGYISNFVCAYNTFDSANSAPNSHSGGSGAMYQGFVNNRGIRNGVVAFNISTLPANTSWSGGDGMFACVGTGVLLCNNSGFSGNSNGLPTDGGGWNISGTNARAYNNYDYNQGGDSLAVYIATNQFTNDNPHVIGYFSNAVWSDYNVYNGASQNNNAFVNAVFGTNNTGAPETTPYEGGWSWAQWTNLYSGGLSANFDPHSVTNTPTWANAALLIPATNDTVLNGQGTNLFALLAPYGITTDFAGNPLPQSGAWPIGAYMAYSAPTNPPAVTAISISVTNNSTFTIVVTNSNPTNISGTFQIVVP